MNRLLYIALAIVGVFGALGAAVGLSANFTLGFFIQQFVEPGTDPTDSTQVGIMFLVFIAFIYALGPVAAGVAGIGVGQALPDRETMAGTIAGIGSFLGFYLFVGLALFFTFSVLAEFSPAPAGNGGGEGGSAGGGGGGSPLDPSGLVTLMLQVSLPVALVGFAVAYLTSRVAQASTGGTAAGDETDSTAPTATEASADS
jgi:hypothetical protein